jgi:hypothetical protein
MNFESYQDIMAERLNELSRQRDKIELAMGSDIDFESPMAQKLDNQLRQVTRQLGNLESIAFYIVQQNDELERLREENARQNNQIVALRQMNERYYLKAQTGMAIAKLHQSKWDSLERQADAWGEQILNQITKEIELQDVK